LAPFTGRARAEVRAVDIANSATPSQLQMLARAVCAGALKIVVQRTYDLRDAGAALARAALGHVHGMQVIVSEGEGLDARR
jgi:NADPH:quinone reductase-like Zn-dependent oxidoreductase